MPNKKLLTKQTLIHSFIFLFISILVFGCSKSTNETVKSEPPTNESSLILQPKIEDDFEGDVKERENWFISQRKYPFDELPENARKKAWDLRPPDAQQDGVEAANWQTVGPSPTTALFVNNFGVTSGRINAVAVSPNDPQLVLIGAATGGIWRSTNGSTTFTAVSDNHVDLSVGSIAFSPSNPAIVYAGMGDKGGEYLGTGILKSTNGGQTWSQINNNTFPVSGRISKIQVDPSNPNRVYVTQQLIRINNTTNNISGFWVSSDGGVNWQRTLAGVATDMVIHPTQASTIYAGFSHVSSGGQIVPGGVFKSTDSGQNWTRVYTAVTGAFNVKLSVSPAAPQWVYMLMGFSNNNALDAKLEISTDAGATWNLRNNTFDKGQIFYNCYILAHPTNQNALLVGTRDVFGSTDAGASYFNLTKTFDASGTYNPPGFGATSHPDQHHAYISPSNPNIIYIANDGGLSRSTDGGVTFQSLNASLSLTMFTSIALHPTNAAISYGGTQDNGTQKRTGNTTWEEFAGGDGGQTVINVLDPSILFATYTDHVIFRFTNNGSPSTQQVIGSPTIFQNDRVAFYPPLVGNEVNSNLYFGTYRLWVSTNQGTSWTAPGGTVDLTNGGNATVSAIGVGKSNINTIYAGSTDGKLSVSTNGGTTWTNRTAGLPNRFMKSIAVNRTDANTAYVTVSGFDSGHVFKTTNAGASWTDISGNLPNIPTNSLLIDVNTPTTLYIGTDVGVFRSVTDGNTWETFNTGMPPVIITELDMQTGGLIQAATFGRGAYQMTVAQGCTYTISPTSQNVGATAGSGNFSMTTAQGCQWQATSNAAWLTTSSNGNGNGTITFNYTANTAAQPRTGQITVGGQTFTVTQAGQSTTCTYSINPSSQNFNASGGAGSFSVTAPAGCAWTTAATSSFVEQLIGNYQSKFPSFNFDFSDSPNATFPANAGTLGAIPDGTSNTPQTPGAPRDVTFTVSGITGNVSNVEISITGTHTWMGDVQATVIAPNGATHKLFGYTGAVSAADFGDSSDLGGPYVFKDTASPPSGGWWQEATARTDTQALTAGDYRTTNSGGAGATNPMPATGMNAAFAGVSDANGVWTLRLTDGTAQDVGSITAASLTVAGTTQTGGWLSLTSGNSGNGNGTVNYSVAALTDQSRTGTITVSANNQTQATHTVNQSVSNRKVLFDFDGDGKSDISVFRPSNGAWYIQQSQNNFTAVTFGQNGDLVTPADFDGDGKTDVAVFRPSNGAWYYLNSSNNAFVGVVFGQNGDVPRPADFDGDGKADINVFRPSNGAWYRLNSSNGSFSATVFGQNGDQPLVADFDGDNKSDITVFRPSAGAFYWLNSSNGSFSAIPFGVSIDIPTMGDFDGDGKTDIAVFRPSNGSWYRYNSSNGAFVGMAFGQNGDIPVTADFDGDGKADVAVFRPSNGAWYYLNSSNGGFVAFAFGLGTDKPIPSAFQ